MRILIFFAFSLLFSYASYAQEIITNLTGNVAKQQHIEKYGMIPKSYKAKSLFLPFKDDFSGKHIYPDPMLWSDNYAFINSTYPKNSVTVGVATLDALNDSGLVYAHADHSSFIADHLTSHPIRLDSVKAGPNLFPLRVSDSLYLSFYFQPQGIGDAPEPHDSLVLEFYSPLDSSWYWAWSAKGQTYQQFFNTHQKSFKRVMIPVKDSLKYYHQGFRFRFKNYASVANTYEPSWAGNVDHWHIDYVYLDINRSKNDTIYEDVAFTEKPTSLLNHYQAVPWAHYVSNPALFPTANNVEIDYINLSDFTRNVSRNFYITDLYDSTDVFNYSGGNLNLLPFSDETFAVPVSHVFNSPATDTALFEIRGVINTTPDINRRNDTVRFYQRFHNYYAYDDGTPESGYGLTPAGSMLAYRYHIHVTDTLKAVKMFFNHTYNNASQRNFYLTIWTGANEPSQIVYEEHNVRPEYEGALNKFHVYFLETPLVLSGTFYIGWRQTTNDNLNIGFDRNTNTNHNIFYNVDGQWRNSMYEGSLMIRPVFGDLFNLSVEPLKGTDKITFTAYPNPVREQHLNFKTSDTSINWENYQLQIFDLPGRSILQTTLNERISLPDNLSNGMYIINISRKNSNETLLQDKFILLR